MALVAQQQWQEGSSSSDEEGGCCGQQEDQFQKAALGQVPPSIRRGFIQKVYAILSVQLLITAAIASYLHSVIGPEYVRSHMSLYYLLAFATLGMIFGMSCCCQDVVRNFPSNYMFLFTFTVLQSIMLGWIAALYKTESVLLAVATTALVFFCLTAYACLTKTDFTGYGPYLWAGLSCLICFMFVVSICSWFMPIPRGVHLIMAGCGVLLFSFYIVYDTQLIVGGSHQVQFSVDDYVFAALNLYMDIINLFIYILGLTGERR